MNLPSVLLDVSGGTLDTMLIAALAAVWGILIKVISEFGKFIYRELGKRDERIDELEKAAAAAVAAKDTELAELRRRSYEELQKRGRS